MRRTTSLRARSRTAVVAGCAALLVGAGACSSEEPEDPQTPEPTNTQDIAEELDRQEVEALYERYWVEITKIENAVDIDAGSLDSVIDDPMLEQVNASLQRYENQGIVRVGEPEISEVEAVIDGDEGRVLACLNEDEWRAEQNGELLPIPDGFEGTRPVGAVTERRDGQWIIVEFISTEDEKTC